MGVDPTFLASAAIVVLKASGPGNRERSGSRSAPGFKILATDYPPSLPKGRVNVNEEILGSKFCLCPSGTGWGMRVFHVMVLGCVPVLVQHDGEHPPVAQAFEPEVLDWHEFAVAVEHDEVKDLPQILESVDLAAKQAALARGAQRDRTQRATSRLS